MKRGTIIAVITIILIVTIASFMLFQKIPEKEFPAYGALPTTEFISNPLEEIPDLNPAAETNPFEDIYTNPFEK